MKEQTNSIVMRIGATMVVSITKGAYHVFVNGTVVTRYDSDWNPKNKPSELENLIYKKWFKI